MVGANKRYLDNETLRFHSAYVTDRFSSYGGRLARGKLQVRILRYTYALSWLATASLVADCFYLHHDSAKIVFTENFIS